MINRYKLATEKKLTSHTSHPLKVYNSMAFIKTQVVHLPPRSISEQFQCFKKKPLHCSLPFPSPSSHWQPQIYFLPLQICLFWAIHAKRITEYVGFSD